GHGGGEVRTEAVRGAAAVAIEGGVAELVVGGALLRVAQRLIGLVQLLELRLGTLVAGIAVGVAVLGEPSERRLDVLLARPPGEPQYVVVVALGHKLVFRSSLLHRDLALDAESINAQPSAHHHLDDTLGCWLVEGWHSRSPPPRQDRA